ncbi:TPA: hypothetical protein ACH5Y3_004878, partial [Escherichia coli]
LLNQESRLPPGSDFRRWVWITIAPFVTASQKLHTVFVLLYEDYLLEIAYWQMAYTVIEPF